MKIHIPLFSGSAPKISPRLLPDDMASFAQNCKFESGQLKPWRDNAAGPALPSVGTRSLFRYASSHWFSSSQDVSYARSLVAMDATERVFLTDPAYPKVTRSDIATVGGGALPGTSYRLGVPAPDAISISNAGGAAAEAEEFDTAYVQTFVNSWGEEGPPSDPSNIITMKDGDTIALVLGSIPSGDYNLANATRRIYRLNSGSVTEYQRVAEIPIASAAHNDALVNAQLGTTLTTEEWIGPPDDNSSLYPEGPMQGIVELDNGMLAGFSGKTVCFCEPFYHHAWPLSYRQTVQDKIVGLCYIGGTLVVLTEGKPVLMSGNHPTNMQPMAAQTVASCVSARGIVDLGRACLYPSPVGIQSIANSEPMLSTENLLSESQWEALNPSSIHAYHYKGRYVGFYDNGSEQAGFIFDPRADKDAWVWLDFYATAGFTNEEEGKLYLVIGDQVVVFDGHASNLLAYTWRSKTFVTAPTNFGFVKLDAQSYPVQVKVIADGEVIFDQSMAGPQEMRLPCSKRWSEWQFELSGRAVVDSVQITQHAGELI